MKKSLHLSVSVAILLSISSLFAAEAYSPIAYGAKARGMGGLGIGFIHGAESAFDNPALISYLQKDEFSLGLTYLTSKSNFSISSDNTDLDSEATLIPYAALSTKLTESISIGATLASLSSLNSNFMTSSNRIVLSEISKTRVTIPVSYTIAGFAVGLAPILEQQSFTIIDSSSAPSTAFGFDLGIAYNLNTLGVLVAADYKSQIKHEHQFGDSGTAGDNIELNTPSEYGIGVSWDIFKSGHSIGVDYKKVNTSETFKVPGDNLTPEDLNSFALGYEYQAKSWAARAGYRYISDLYDLAKMGEAMIYLPYNTTSHLTLGGSYSFNDSVSGDLAFVYATDDMDYTDGGTTINVKNDQTSLTVGINYLF